MRSRYVSLKVYWVNFRLVMAKLSYFEDTETIGALLLF